MLLCVALRYPLVEHERFQTDSYYVHNLGQSIADFGYAKWTFSPLSYFGFYPLSYPSGVPFVLAEVSQLTGLSMEFTILLTGMFLSILFCFTCFCLAREFTTRPEYALLFSLFVLLGPRFVDTTYWDASARGAAVVLMTLLVFVSFRVGFWSSRGYWPLLILLGFACFAVHRMSVLLVLYGLAYLMAVPCYRFVRGNYASRSRRGVIAAFLVMSGTLSLATLTFFELLEFSFESSFSESGFFDIGSPTLSLLLNVGVSFTHQIGFVIVPAAFGLLYVFKRAHMSTKSLYPVTIIVAFIPMIGNALYISMLMAPFVAVLGVGWLGNLLRSRRSRSFVLGLIAVLIAGSVALTSWSVDRWNAWPTDAKETVEVDPRVFSDVSYISVNCAGYNAIASRESMAILLDAATGTYFLKSGIVTTINGDVVASDVNSNRTTFDVEFPNNLYTWFTYQDYYFVDGFVWELMNDGAGFPGSNPLEIPRVVDYAELHSHLFIVVDNRYPGVFSNAYYDYPSRLLRELDDGVTEGGGEEIFAYSLYQSEIVTLYLMELNV